MLWNKLALNFMYVIQFLLFPTFLYWNEVQTVHVSEDLVQCIFSNSTIFKFYITEINLNLQGFYTLFLSFFVTGAPKQDLQLGFI